MFTRILCPIDFDDNSLDALRMASRLAQESKARLYVLHVVKLTNPTVISAPLIAEETGRLAREGLDRVSKEELADVEHETLLRSGHAASEILAAETDIKADLVVMGTHGRSGVAHLVLGSVAEHVVRESPCAVLTVRAKPVATEAGQESKRPAA
jgi:universal stress protein A